MSYVGGAQGDIGVIASVTEPFCSSCTRARLTADGKLVTCLFTNTGHNLKVLLRAGMVDEKLLDVLRNVWLHRKDRYSELRAAQASSLSKVEMSYIGG